MKVKTYGISGLLEWHGVLDAGSIKMKVSFTNGTVTGYGVAPATFTTSDELTQFVIEHSDQYKKGRIALLREMEVPDDAATKARKARALAAQKAAVTAAAEGEGGNAVAAKETAAAGTAAVTVAGPAAEPPGTVAAGAGRAAAEPGAEAGEASAEPRRTVAGAGANEAEAEGDAAESEAAGTETAGCMQVKVADKSEAVEYLKEHFAWKNYTATSLRTRAAFDAACKECGVEFVFAS